MVQKPFAKDGLIRHLPLFLGSGCEFRSLPAIAEVPLRDRFPKIDQPASQDKAAFYAGCLIDFAYPEIGEAVVKVLNRAGVEVVFPPEQTCCGAPARYSGAYESAAQSAVANIDALLRDDVRWIVSACPTCTVALKLDFREMLHRAGMQHRLADADVLAAKVIDFSSLVSQLAAEGRLDLEDVPQEGVVTYHDSCHLKRTLKVSQEPRDLLRQAGYSVVEMAEADICCGMGGAYSMKLPEISAPILERKLRNAAATGADTVAMDCPGCAMQIRGGLDKKGSPLEVRHTAELLAGRLDAPKGRNDSFQTVTSENLRGKA
jgi:Fe-S oxidoreductase